MEVWTLSLSDIFGHHASETCRRKDLKATETQLYLLGIIEYRRWHKEPRRDGQNLLQVHHSGCGVALHNSTFKPNTLQPHRLFKSQYV